MPFRLIIIYPMISNIYFDGYILYLNGCCTTIQGVFTYQHLGNLRDARDSRNAYNRSDNFLYNCANICQNDAFVFPSYIQYL